MNVASRSSPRSSRSSSRLDIPSSWSAAPARAPATPTRRTKAPARRSRPTRASRIPEADIVVRVAKPADAELEGIRRGAVLVGFLAPLGDPASVERYAQRGITALSMETIPRTTKAQAMDALSSQANIGGYKAALLAANYLPKFFPMLTTAAGRSRRRRRLIIGAGVAGLQAIATCRRLGAVVTAYDTRSVVAEQVKVAGREVPRDRRRRERRGAGRLRERAVAGSDRQAARRNGEGDRRQRRRDHHRRDPRQARADPRHRRSGRRDGARQRDRRSRGRDRRQRRGHAGRPGRHQRQRRDDRRPANLASDLAYDASRLYARNVQALLDYIIKDGALALDPTDEIVAGTTITRDGEVVHAPTRAALTGGAA